MLLVFSIIILSGIPASSANAQLFLTEEEQDYINKVKLIKAVSLHGTAPIQYMDSEGQIKGISIDLLEEISQMTGLTFEYHLYDTIDEMFNSEADIVFGLPYNYATETMVLSQPYLESETILYINSSVDSSQLYEKVYAAVKGSDLPEGIKEENAIYFDTREESMEAVESGKADYGYGNAYSVSFYTLQNNFKNIITVPKEKESREYCVGMLKDNQVLLSIINKSINSIEKSHIQTLILDATTQIERKIKFSLVLDAYGVQIFGITFLVIIILLVSIILNLRSKRQLIIQNERYQILSQTSNEYLYEYNIREKKLQLSKNCVDLFNRADNFYELVALLKKVLISNNFNQIIPSIELPIDNGQMRIFKSINSTTYDERGRAFSIIGKLVDISKEEIEKQELIRKSEIDGLTCLYNATTSKKLITENIAKKDPGKKCALIILDCDNFKEINDSYGHLQGNKILECIGRGLCKTFSETDIKGRIGGDEFCVYMGDVDSIEFVLARCKEFMEFIGELNLGYHFTVSMGVRFSGDRQSYEDLFVMADKALYVAKKKGGNQIQFLQ